MNQGDFDEAFDVMRQDAAKFAGEIVGDLVKKHPFDALVVIQALQGCLGEMGAYFMALPECCAECGEPLARDDNDDDFDELDEDDVRPSDN